MRVFEKITDPITSMNEALGKLSIKQKLVLIIMLVCSMAMVLASFTLVYYDLRIFKKKMVEDLAVSSEMLSDNCTSSLAFFDREDARQILNSLRAKKTIIFACIYDEDGRPFATYKRDSETQDHAPASVKPQRSHFFKSDRLVMLRTVNLNSLPIGTIYLESDLKELDNYLFQIIITTTVVMLFALLGALALSSLLQKFISRPISNLSSTAVEISNTQDFSRRAKRFYNDDIGELTDSFNNMLHQIERKNQELTESEEKYRNLVDLNPDPVVIIQNFKLVYISSAFTRVFGYTLDELSGDFNSLNLLASYDRGKTRDLYDEKRVITQTTRLDVISKEKNVITCEVFSTHIQYNDKPAVLLIVHDITERLQAEKRQLRLTTAIEQAGETIIITDIEGRIQYANPAFEKITGYEIKDILGEKANFLKSGKHSNGFYKELWETITNGKTWSGHFINKRKDGSILEEEVTISPVKDRSQQIVNFVAVKRDVTNEIILEEQLRQAQKMEAIGTLAGGIAHDFNNILFPIIGYTEMLIEDVPENSLQKKNLEEIYKAANRAKNLVQQILTFSRQDPQEMKPLKSHLIIKEAVKLMRSTIPSSIEMIARIDSSCGPVLADPIHIHQIVMNLCTNAYQAIQVNSGRIEIVLEEVFHESKDHAEVGPAAHVKLTVTDTGLGMTRDVLKRIFDPYFTTKEPGKGTGLGLAVVHGIVKKCNGDIKVKSAPGKGTKIEVYLPVCENEKEVTEIDMTPIQTGTENVLLVDDEEIVTGAGKQMLEQLGYRVTVLTNSMEALELFKVQPDKFDIVITDYAMPNMTGVELAKKILELNINVPIILCTGFSEEITEKKAADLGIRGYLMKPLNKKQIANAVRKVLDHGLS